MIETTYTRKCDICGKQMGHEHVIITWPGGHKDDVCHDCTKSLNEKLREMREVREKNDGFIVVGFKDIPWALGEDGPFTYLGKFSSQKKAEVCMENRKADFDYIVVAKNTEAAMNMLLAEKKKNSDANRGHTDEVRMRRNVSDESDTVNMHMLLDEFYRDTGFLADLEKYRRGKND